MAEWCGVAPNTTRTLTRQLSHGCNGCVPLDNHPRLRPAGRTQRGSVVLWCPATVSVYCVYIYLTHAVHPYTAVRAAVTATPPVCACSSTVSVNAHPLLSPFPVVPFTAEPYGVQCEAGLPSTSCRLPPPNLLLLLLLQCVAGAYLARCAFVDPTLDPTLEPTARAHTRTHPRTPTDQACGRRKCCGKGRDSAHGGDHAA